MSFSNLLNAKIFKTFLGILAILFLNSCAGTHRFFTDQPVRQLPEKSPAPQTPVNFKLLTIKSPVMTYYDYALLRKEEDRIVIELFKLGNNIGNISIFKNKICFMADCAPKWPSAKKFFGSVSYGDLFDDIILGKDIFKGKGKMVGAQNTTIQRFQENGQIIYYEHRDGHILFRNMNTGMMIQLDDYIDPAKQYDITDDDE